MPSGNGDSETVSATVPESGVEVVTGFKYKTVEQKSHEEIVKGLRMMASGLGMIIKAYVRLNRLEQ